jgi:tetratricopeptide (TPR) repeat protein
MLVLTMFAALLVAPTPALLFAQDEPPAEDPASPDSASEEQPAAEATPAGTTGAPTLNKAKPLALDTLADKAARYPDNPYILNEYGNQLLRRGRLAEAEAIYERAVDLSPNFVQAWNNLGLAYQAQRKFGKAKRAYKQAIELAPNFAIVHYNLGTAYEASGSYKKMISSYQRALELDRRLSLPEFNPQIGTNEHLSAVLLQIYTDRGGSAYYPVLSAYPDGK